MAIYKIISTGAEIVAEQAFMDAAHAGDYVLVTPDNATAASLGWRITPLAFCNRIGDVAMDALYVAAATNYQLQLYRDQMWAAGSVGLNDPQTITDVNNLVTLGLITSAQATAILTMPVSQNELPR